MIATAPCGCEYERVTLTWTEDGQEHAVERWAQLRTCDRHPCERHSFQAWLAHGRGPRPSLPETPRSP
jgi:hypothetical protein